MRRFKSLFNTACVPFYWKTLEPEPDNLRYETSGKEIYRRPPPDPVLDFCEKNAVAGEDKWGGGFLNEDMSPKPSYYALNELINKEWKSSVSQHIENNGPVAFRGFYGDYSVKISVGKETIEKKFSIKKGHKNVLSIDI
jgi:hypothetical protein